MEEEKAVGDEEARGQDFSSLPSELIHLIFTLCSYPDLLNALLVCTSWLPPTLVIHMISLKEISPHPHFPCRTYEFRLSNTSQSSFRSTTERTNESCSKTFFSHSQKAWTRTSFQLGKASWTEENWTLQSLARWLARIHGNRCWVEERNSRLDVAD